MTSKTTETLVDILRSRDATGQAKYGVSLDRPDLTPEQWCQHAIEELLDAAGYLQRLMETTGELRIKISVMQDEIVNLRSDTYELRQQLGRAKEINAGHESRNFK